MATEKKLRDLQKINSYKKLPEQGEYVVFLGQVFLVKDAIKIERSILIEPYDPVGILKQVDDLIVSFRDKKLFVSFVV